MTQILMYSIILSLSLIFMQMNHPLAMGLMLLMQTTMICILSGVWAKTFWFSYILFLVFLGGMLVLFIYTTSLASNEMFTTSIKTMMSFIFMIILSILIFMLMNKTNSMYIHENMEMKIMNNLENMVPNNTMSLIKLYNYPTNMINILLINYLFITLVATVKITNSFFGPIRSMK